jgi:hypothetical protein
VSIFYGNALTESEKECSPGRFLGNWLNGELAPEIQQLYAKEQVTRNKNGVSISYNVFVIDHNGREKKLLSGLTTDTQARFVEREIESILGLEDRNVAGELS